MGYDMIDRCAAFNLTGPKGTASVLLMGKGIPVSGGRPESSKCRYDISGGLRMDTGLGDEAELAPPEEQIAPAVLKKALNKSPDGQTGVSNG